MSRRASLTLKQSRPERRRVHFTDEVVMEDSIKEGDEQELFSLLRRHSLTVDINAINQSGLTPLHQACLDGNLAAVHLLVKHGASIDLKDDDGWTPLHAACAMGYPDICRYLLKKGADRNVLSRDNERPLDLIDQDDFDTIAVMLQNKK